MGDSFTISGLRRKRARIAGEIIQAQEIVARRTKELLAIDAVIRLFSGPRGSDAGGVMMSSPHPAEIN
jgi:hypothetical protein